ncbi:DUF4160 domain-containing protein [Geminicoccus roseus]|uniref:DUF4160 domain-containing protein n=1 Tax=Geminicoccus roseus TaxID=404900 RepID=UPI0009FF90B8|nr:DUF4160 domain-containing protein [Geminicoccus roseus]
MRSAGFPVRIYLNDHAPPHVHVIGASGETKTALGKGAVGTFHLTNVGMIRSEAATTLRLVAENIELCRACWKEIHG